MTDPVGAFDTIKDNFIRYIKTAFRTKFDSVEQEREELLNQDRVLYREPWIEILPEYLSSGFSIENLPGEFLPGFNATQIGIFKSLVSRGLAPKGFELYHHQAKMLQSALNKKHCVITSGTGSGKTESFLLPLFAQIAKESGSWSKVSKPDTSNNWWDTVPDSQVVDVNNGFILSSQTQQRSHETRPAAMRALILYPMNALVEDQMSRLRLALDSQPVREWLKNERGDNRIYFGRYNSATPVPGKLSKVDANGNRVPNLNKVRNLKRELLKIERNAARVEQYIDQQGKTGKDADDLRAFFPRLDGAEMRCRFDMQVAAPDIFITNFSMLSIMLMRDIDDTIFEQTKRWLTCEDIEEGKRDAEKENRVFHLVIDELHLYRGTPGTEISYLVKLLLYRLGLHPRHPQLRILASSASLEPGDPQSLNYLGDFFGFDGKNEVQQCFEIITGEYAPVGSFSSEERKLPAEPFALIAEAYDNSKNTRNETFSNACASAASQLNSSFNLANKGGNGIEQLLNAICNPAIGLRERMHQAARVNGKYRAICTFSKENDVDSTTPYFFEELFGSTLPNETLRKSARGLLIARELLSDSDVARNLGLSSKNLPRFRFHYFLRNIEGMWASLRMFPSPDERTVGELYPTALISTKDGYRALELLYCDNCGTLLLGGSRGKSKEEHGFEMLPVTPNIEGIPEKTTAKLVEKRTYQEYAVFWPVGSQPLLHDPNDDTWKQRKLPGVTLDDDAYQAYWSPASLNRYSGQIRRQHKDAENNEGAWIKGFVFKVVERKGLRRDLSEPNTEDKIPETHRALPCVCPACGLDESNKKVKFSPIRGFRTGFAKTTQILAKELIYQLPGKEDQRKLVVFSDSREDAAQIANGIERNHYNDLLREIIVQEMHNDVLAKSKIVAGLKAGDDTTSLQEQFPELYEKVYEKWYDSVNKDEKLRRRRDEALGFIAELEARTIPVRSLIRSLSPEECAPFIAGMIAIGANPAGLDIAFQKNSETGESWEKMFDFVTRHWKNVDGAFYKKINSEVFTNLGSLFFGNLFYSLEASGLGYLTVNPNDTSIESEAGKLGIRRGLLIEILSGSIRVLGHKYYFSPNDSEYPKTPLDLNANTPKPAALKKYLAAVSGQNSLELKDLWFAVRAILTEQGILKETGIQLEALFIKVASEDDPAWISPRGKRIHLHRSGGICTQYPDTKLAINYSCRCIDIWDKNYYSYHAAIEKRDPVRLHCEELTGQTDDQYTRQRHFRNVILNGEGERKVKQIDLLSVTTTLEVGVDIGSLQAVMLANMPPQRFNYQQRVGRAGRRGQAYSIVLTFCRGRSHDDHYFSYPEKITGDPPPAPFLTTDQPRILKRLISKEILRQAFKSILPLMHDQENDIHSVHGDFGAIGDWTRYKPELVNWLNVNESQIKEIIVALKPAIPTSELDELLKWAKSENHTNENLLGRLDAVVANEEIATMHISEKLAEGGVLPMFGMPTSQKELYHEITNNNEFAVRSIDRDSGLAIYEFAPGAQKTKDKAIHTAIGFTTDLIARNTGHPRGVINNEGSPFYNERWMVHCKECGAIKTEKENPGSVVCQECNNPSDVYPIKSPVAYRTNYSCGEDSKENVDILLSRPPVFAEPNTDSKIKQNSKNNFHASVSDQDVTWRVNTNGGKLFEGRIYNTTNLFPFNRNQPFTFENQWILESRAQSSDENGYWFMGTPVGEKPESIAIAANKKTEVFRLFPSTVNRALSLDMYAGYKIGVNGIRSAYFSAAFLFQRVLADQLDVDPTEIEIADIRRVPGTNVAEIVLTDELPNGSGFVRVLFDGIEEIINQCTTLQKGDSYLASMHQEGHLDNCQDACYDCLKGFRNMNYHGLLDWKLATALLHAMNDSNYTAGADGNFSDSFEIKNWLTEAQGLAKSFVNSFPGTQLITGKNELPVIANADKSVFIIVIHPLWNCYESRDKTIVHFPQGIWLGNEIEKTIRMAGGDHQKIRFIDTFNLHRRLGWCYQNVFNTFNH
jgi:DEAD/DEAH box helicase domain-containing protein